MTLTELTSIYFTHSHAHFRTLIVSHFHLHMHSDTPKPHFPMLHTYTQALMHVFMSTSTYMCTHTPAWAHTNKGVLIDPESTYNLTHACTHYYTNIRLSLAHDHTCSLT